MRLLCFGCALLAAVSVVPRQARGNFHLWTINEIFSNADGTIQFIELANTFSSTEHFIGGHAFESVVADKTFIYPSHLPSPPSTTNRKFLMATAGFAALPGAVTPNYVIPNAFFSITGDTLIFAGLDSVTFGAGQLPTNGVLSLNRNLTTGVNSPTNFAGAVGSIDASPPPLLGDANDDGVVDIFDVNVVSDNWGETGPEGDVNGDMIVDIFDVNLISDNWSSSSAPVPEASAWTLLIVAVVVLAPAWLARQGWQGRQRKK